MNALYPITDEDQENLNLELLEESNEDLILRIAFAASNYERLLKVLYSYDVFDIAKIQSILSDIALDLNAKMPEGELTITRKKDKNSMHHLIY